jgi:hypothetical protein
MSLEERVARLETRLDEVITRLDRLGTRIYSYFRWTLGTILVMWSTVIAALIGIIFTR